MLCGPKERCFVNKKPNGTFEASCVAASSKTPTHHKDHKSDGGNGNIMFFLFLQHALKYMHLQFLFLAACKQPKVAGHCRANTQRFYYNAATKQCESFLYGGCQGNDNNFLTKTACEKVCKA